MSSTPTLAELKQLGTELGLTGTDLRDFICKQQDDARNERAAEREAAREENERSRNH